MTAHRLRRIAILLCASVAVVDLTAGVGVLWLHRQDSSAPVATDDVLAEFRAGVPAPGAEAEPSSTVSGPTPGAGGAGGAGATDGPAGDDTASAPVTTGDETDAVASETPSDAIAAPARLTRPDAGVYVYETSGFEEIDALGGARHEYPDETTIVVHHTECGTTEEWHPLEERVDIRQVCTDGRSLRLDWYDSFHSFFGQTDHRRLECDDASTWLESDTVPGDTYDFACTDPETNAQNGSEYLAVEPITIGGTTVEALHVRFTSVVTGKSEATTTQEVWLDPRTGLTLRKHAVLDGSSPGPSGDVAYHEEYELVLTSLEPLR